MFPDLATPNDLAIADWRRQAFNSDLVWADRVVRGDADVPEDELPVQPRRQTTDEQKAFALWGRQMQQEPNEAAREDAIQGWLDYFRASSIFERKRR
jgi:hypothetical protein